MKTASTIVMRFLAALLLIAAALKGYQLLTEPAANNDIWSYRPFLILTVEFELALAIWLLSGLFKKAAWLTTVSCFSLFSFITLYKALTGAASCGCFGSVQVNPWVTLFAIDLPAVIALLIFAPDRSFLPRIVVRGKLQQESKSGLLRNLLTPLPSLPRLTTTALLTLLVLCTTTAVLALNVPAKVTSSYEVLEPETWIGKKLPILEYIDIGNELKKGTWLLLFYHHDCSDCQKAIPKYEQMAYDLKGNEDFLKIALIEVPPYSQAPANQNSPCTLSRLANVKEWFITTPSVVLLMDNKVVEIWEKSVPDMEKTFNSIARTASTE